MLISISLPDLDPIPKPTLIPTPIELKYEPSILHSHILLLKNECELELMIWTKLKNQL